jgi:hypothetical protein
MSSHKAAKAAAGSVQKNANPNAHRQQYAVEKKLNEKKKEKENPFDRFANARKKHEVLNRKVKGEDRNVGRARAKVRSSLLPPCQPPPCPAPLYYPSVQQRRPLALSCTKI